MFCSSKFWAYKFNCNTHYRGPKASNYFLGPHRTLEAGGGINGVKKCWKCGKTGHVQRNCTQGAFNVRQVSAEGNAEEDTALKIVNRVACIPLSTDILSDTSSLVVSERKPVGKTFYIDFGRAQSNVFRTRRPKLVW
jgi:Zinc knuckle